MLNSKSQSPIFIVGAPRSGTTLLSSMLSAHPAIAISPETAFMLHWWSIRQWYGDLNDERRFSAFWADYVKQGRFLEVGVDSELVLRRIRKAHQVNMRTVFIATMEEYASRMGKRRWGEKSPGHERHIDVLLEWFPTAKVVFLIRDPRAVYASMLKVPWGIKNICWQTALWRDSVNILRRFSADRRVLAVKYEVLVQNPEVELRRLCTFIGEDYTSKMIHGRTELTGTISSERSWTQNHLKSTVERPVTTDSIEKWREQLTPFQMETIERMARREMRALGYRSVNRGFSFRQYLCWTFILKPHHAAKRMISSFDSQTRNLFRRITPFQIMPLVRRFGR